MNFRLINLVAATILVSASPSANAASSNTANAKRIGCFIEVMVPAKYRVTKVKIQDSYRQYLKYPSGKIELMEYPAKYREDKTLIEREHLVMREIVCN